MGLILSEGAVDVLPDKFSYDINVDSGVESFDLQPLPSSDEAKIQVSAKGSNESFHVILPHNGLYRVSIAESGKTIVSMKIIAEDGETERTYTLIVDRALRQDALLSEIKVSEGEVNVADRSNEYRLELENHIDHVTVSPVANDSEAKTRMEVHFPSGDTSELKPSANGEFDLLGLPVGDTSISLIVTAQDPTVSDVSVLTVTRRASGDTSLSSLEVVGAALLFEPTIAEYNVEFVDESESLVILMDASHPGSDIEATVELDDGSVTNVAEIEPGVYEASRVGLGNSVVKIYVTAEDGISTQTYTVEVTRRADKRSEVVDQIWSLLAKDDISGAYWLSRALESQGLAPASATRTLACCSRCHLVNT